MTVLRLKQHVFRLCQHARKPSRVIRAVRFRMRITFSQSCASPRGPRTFISQCLAISVSYHTRSALLQTVVKSSPCTTIISPRALRNKQHGLAVPLLTPRASKHAAYVSFRAAPHRWAWLSAAGAGALCKELTDANGTVCHVHVLTSATHQIVPTSAQSTINSA